MAAPLPPTLLPGLPDLPAVPPPAVAGSARRPLFSPDSFLPPLPRRRPPADAMAGELGGIDPQWQPRRGTPEQLAALEDEARALGVKRVDYADDVELGELANAALREAAALGWELPDEIHVSAARAARLKARGTVPKDASASTVWYADGRRVVVFDPRHEGLIEHTPSATMYYLVGIWSTGEAHHVARHEVAHAAVRLTAPARLLTTAERQVARRVSTHAASTAREFLSEVGAALLGGYTVDEEALALYRQLGGATPRG